MAIASWPFCGCGYCVMLAVGQSVPAGDVLAYGQPLSQRPLGTSWPTASNPRNGLLGRPGLRPATLATASWDVLAYGQPPHGATFLGGSLHRGSVLCTPPPALALISPLENVKTTNFQYFRQIYFVDIQ